jgi:hypothetical protein
VRGRRAATVARGAPGLGRRRAGAALPPLLVSLECPRHRERQQEPDH